MTSQLKRAWPLAVLLALGAAAWFGGLADLVSLRTLQENRERLSAFVEANFLLSVAIYAAAYVLVVALSIPGAVFMTLAGGFLFGTLVGGSATVVGATTGAIVIFLATRSALGRPLRARAEAGGGLLKRLIEGVEKDAFSYILTLRLVPAAPFWMVNVAAGLADAPLRSYALATLFGIMPATFVYASVGAGLDSVFAAGAEPDLASVFRDLAPPLAALGLLALSPVVWRRLVKRRSAP